MGKLDAAWSAGDLAKAVCDELVSKGLLKEKPAFIREDREKKLTQVFAAAKLDGASMATMNGRGVEVAVRSTTQGEGWVDDLQKVLKGMLPGPVSDPSRAEKNAGRGGGAAKSHKGMWRRCVCLSVCGACVCA